MFYSYIYNFGMLTNRVNDDKGFGIVCFKGYIRCNIPLIVRELSY